MGIRPPLRDSLGAESERAALPAFRAILRSVRVRLLVFENLVFE